MSVWAITMVKDEIDVIEPVLRHVAAQGVAGIIVADNASTDGTWEALRKLHLELACDLVVIPDEEVAYYQSRKMSALAEQAHAAGATWIWPFDADEVWYFGTKGERLADVIERAPGTIDVIHSRLWHHRVTVLDPEPNEEIEPGSGRLARSPFERMRYREREEAPLGKVIVRWRPGSIIHQGNHDVMLQGAGPHPASVDSDVQVRHFPYRSEDQFVRKAINGTAAYAATDLPMEIGLHWREFGAVYARGGLAALRAAYRKHFVHDLPTASGLVYDPARLDS